MAPAAPSTFGHVPGILAGHEFASRLELWGAGVHRQTQAGISARRGVGAESIVLSGRYEDDEDLGSVLIYTGKGGRSAESGKQVADQTLTGSNLELVRNQTSGLPVRVTRKVTENRLIFYRYAGLYRVVSHWTSLGRSGFEVWRFRLEAIVDEPADFGFAPLAPTAAAYDLFAQAAEPEADYTPAPRREHTTLRIVRDTAVTRRIKQLYEYSCQVCGTRLDSAAGPYAEAAHIQPLGAPHYGPDTLANVLCLCPNHHVLFDLGSWAIQDDFTLLGLPGALRQNRKHSIDLQFLQYHRQHFFNPPAAEAE